MTETIERVKAYMMAISQPITIEKLARDLKIKEESEVKAAISSLYQMQMIDPYPAAGGVQSRYKIIKPDLRTKASEEGETLKKKVKGIVKVEKETQTAPKYQAKQTIFMVSDGTQQVKVRSEEQAVALAKELAVKHSKKIEVYGIISMYTVEMTPKLNEVDLLEVIE